MEQAQIELWVLEAQAGSTDAFAQLCRHFQPKLLRFAFKLTNNEQLASDAVQNAWLKVTNSITRIRDPRAFRSWIYQAVRWQTLDLTRKQQYLLKIHSEENIEEIIQEPNKQESVNGVDELLNLINHLPDIDKQAIHLFYLEEMSLQEISIILEVPVGTIKSRLNRARNTLREKFNETF